MKIKLFQFLLFISIIFFGCSISSSYYQHTTAFPKVNPYTFLNHIKGLRIIDKEKISDDKLLLILSKYSKDAYYLIQRMEALPSRVGFPEYFITGDTGMATRTTVINGRVTIQRITAKGFKKWIDLSKPFLEQVMTLSTAVHEECHGYSSRFALYLFSKVLSNYRKLIYYENGRKRTARFDTYYRNKNTNLYVLERNNSFSQYTTSFPTLWIAPLIPQEKRTFRFKTYVINRNQSTNTNGFSGLLDEYNAYYWSNKVNYDLYNYFLNELDQTPKSWSKWAQNIFGLYFSYAEFRYWLITYLYLAKTKYKNVYKSLMADEILRSAFTQIDDDFTGLIHQIFNKLFKELPAHLKRFGYEVNIKAVNTIRNNKKTRSIYYKLAHHLLILFENEYLPLQEELTKLKYRMIVDEFRTSPAKPFPILRIPNN